MDPVQCMCVSETFAGLHKSLLWSYTVHEDLNKHNWNPLQALSQSYLAPSKIYALERKRQVQREEEGDKGEQADCMK